MSKSRDLRRGFCFAEWFFRDSALALHGVKAAAVELDKLRGVVFRFNGGSSRKARSARTTASVCGCGSDEFHHVKCDVFVAPGAKSGGHSFHGSFSCEKNSADSM